MLAARSGSKKRRNRKEFPRPYEVNLGYNDAEEQRARDFVALNERDWLHWRFPLIEAGMSRGETWEICEKAGFSILVGMYRKMGRFDCFWCPNQTQSEALRVAAHYPELAKEWMEAEQRKGHSFLPVSLKMIVENDAPLFRDLPDRCGCFGGAECIVDEE